jgi:hypothetical protein
VMRTHDIFVEQTVDDAAEFASNRHHAKSGGLLTIQMPWTCGAV